MLGVQMHELAMAFKSLYPLLLIAFGSFIHNTIQPVCELEVIERVNSLRI